MRTALVAMIDVLGEHRFEVTSRVDEQVVEAVFTDGADPGLGERVRVGGPDGGLDDPDPICGEDCVEGPGELGVPIPDEARVVVDADEHVEPAEQHGVDAEEVTSDQILLALMRTEQWAAQV